jgi:hypothetical protein
MKSDLAASSRHAGFYLSRRRFLQTVSASAALAALPGWGADALDLVNRKPRRVGLIGAGWYGKSDLWRLIQVTPVEVVALCDPDRQMLDEAVTIARQRQKSGNTPRVYADYRRMLKEHQFDIVIIGTPDHWHALQAIASIEAGADVYLRSRSASTSGKRGDGGCGAQARRVVQIGTQRKSTPHLIEAKQRVIDAGCSARSGMSTCAATFTCAPTATRRWSPCPIFSITSCGPVPRRCVPMTDCRTAAGGGPSWSTATGSCGDMCVHMLDTARWMLGVGWPRRISSRPGGIYVQKEGKSNISDTQTATFEYGPYNLTWQHRTWGSPPDP